MSQFFEATQNSIRSEQMDILETGKVETVVFLTFEGDPTDRGGIKRIGFVDAYETPREDLPTLEFPSRTAQGVFKIPGQFMPFSEAFFWSPEWQQGEKEADEDWRTGNTESFENPEDAIRWLMDRE